MVPLVLAEERSFERLNERECNQLPAITEKHMKVLEEERKEIKGIE